MTNGQDIRDARQRAGLTQAELARLVGVSQRTVGNWERGETVSHNRWARVQDVLSGHWKDDDPDQVGLASASDVELLAEIARRFARTAQEARHDRQDQQEPGPEAGSQEHRGEGSSAHGGTPSRRTPSIVSFPDQGKPWKKNLPPQLSPDKIAELERRQQDADGTTAEEISGWAAWDDNYPTPEGAEDDE